MTKNVGKNKFHVYKSDISGNEELESIANPIVSKKLMKTQGLRVLNVMKKFMDRNLPLDADLTL